MLLQNVPVEHVTSVKEKIVEQVHATMGDDAWKGDMALGKLNINFS